MDRRLVSAVVLCLAILLGWNWVMGALYPPPPGGAPVKGTAPRTSTPAVVAPRPPVEPPVAPPPPPPPPPVPDEPETTGRLATERLHVELSSIGGGTLKDVEVWGCTHHAPEDAGVDGDPGRINWWIPGREAALSLDIFGAGPEASGLASASWSLEEVGGVWVARSSRGGVEVTKTLAPSKDPADPYHAELTVTVANRGAVAGAACVAELVGLWMPHSIHAIPEDGLVVAAVGESPEQIRPSEVASTLAGDPTHERRAATGWRYIAVRCDFYLGAILPLEPLPATTAVGFRAARVLAATPNGPVPADTASASLRIPFTMPEAGAETTWKFLVYMGPDSRDVLGRAGSAYEPLLDAFPNRSFWIFSFGPISRFLGWLLSVLADGVGLGWGLAVCMLTVLVRGALFPLSRKTQISMRLHAQRMGKMKPKLDALKAKFKDNPKKQQEETMRLFREEKVSILPGGCLLAFLQMPVWISLYGTLQTTFEMRHASFLWFDDLTAPDHMFEMPWMRSVWGLGGITGGWFNLLPLLMMVTWWGSAAMTPLPEDPEQRSQAKMMRWIPLLFGVFLYQTAAGLTLYMTLSALWSIGETTLIRKVWLSKIEIAPAVAAKPVRR